MLISKNNGDVFKDVTDGPLWSLPLFTNIEPYLESLGGKTILVLGAGDGKLASCLSSYGAVVYAVDKLISARWQSSFGVCYLGGNNEQLPFSDNSFDVIVSCSTFQYVDHELVFSEIVRVGKNSATVLLNENLPGNPIINIYRLKRKIKSLFDSKMESYLVSIGRYLTPSHLEYAGIKIDSYQCYYFLSAVNYKLRRYEKYFIMSWLSTIFYSFDRFVIRKIKFLEKFCWFCTYRLIVEK